MFRQDQLTALFAGRRILIAGYGREGKSTHDLLQRLLPDARPDIAGSDSEIFDLLEQARRQGVPYDLVVKSPGIASMKFEGRCNPGSLTSQTDLFLQVYADITTAVTGTKGKSTTTALIHHVLCHSLPPQRHVVMAGNMGIPLFDMLDQLDDRSVVVAEFSCHQLEIIHHAPHIGVILNLYQEHLDHYRDYHDYQMAKMQMMLQQRPGDHCFYCSDCHDLADRVAEVRPRVRSVLHPYSLAAGPMDETADLKGKHNASNAIAAQLVTEVLGVTAAQFHAALPSFKALPHRLEPVGSYEGITFYNDSISTIPEATIAAVEALRQVDTLILGGLDRGIDYAPLALYLANASHAGSRINNIIFVGAAGTRMLNEWRQHPAQPVRGRNILVEDDYSAIVDWCYRNTQTSRICLLSPAAASYDAFRNFEHRGDTFKKLVREHRTPAEP